MNSKYRIAGMSEYDVMRFQSRNGLIVDGMVGHKTMDKMLETGIIKMNSEAYNSWAVNNKDYRTTRSYYNIRGTLI